MSSRVAAIAIAILGLCAAVGPASAQTSKKSPPACAAISFRPLNVGMPDGEHIAGMYRSRFGKMELMGVVKGGQPQDYYLTVNGKRLEGGEAQAPKSAEACLKSKNVKLPYATQKGACTGERFRVVIDNSGQKKVLMLFGLQGEAWQLCRVGTV